MGWLGMALKIAGAEMPKEKILMREASLCTRLILGAAFQILRTKFS